MTRTFVSFAFAWGALAGCGGDGTSSSSSVAPSGVFTRSVADPAGTQTVTLAFVSGKGARLAQQNGTTQRTCFSYEPSASGVKATLKLQAVSNKGATTSQDLSGRIVEAAVSMSADGSKLDSSEFLETGRFEYARDATTSAADVLSTCP